jgi:hypothetical protein
MTIEHNINQAEEIVRRIDAVNKGRYAHELHSGRYRLEALIKEAKAEKPTDLKNEKFRRLCSTKQNLAATLYYATEEL